MKYKKLSLLILLVMITSIVLVARYSIRDVARSLQEALVEKAMLERTVVRLEEENKVYRGVFNCIEVQKYYISKELGLGKKGKEEGIKK